MIHKVIAFARRMFRRDTIVNVKLDVQYVKASRRFVDCNVLVSGGSSGIGKAVVKQFLFEGARVVACARTRAGLDALEKEFCSDRLYTLEMDVSDVAAIPVKLAAADSLLGGGGISIFVNCAGVSSFGGNMEPAEEIYDNIMDVNAKGLYFMNKLEGEYLVARGVHGKIVNITSKAGERIGFDPYTLSKWGANSITKGIARKLAPYHINVNGVAPGRCPTNITAELQSHIGSDNVWTWGNSTQRFTMPEEVASMVLYLASGAANQIVGQIIVMDGGSYD